MKVSRKNRYIYKPDGKKLKIFEMKFDKEKKKISIKLIFKQ